MNFRDYYLLQERDYFVNLMGFTDKLIKKLKNKKGYEEGQAVWDANTLTIEIYLGKILDPSVKNVFASLQTYFPFPEELNSVLRHEISHAYEDIVKKIDLKGYDTTDSKKYYNSDTEVNAYLNSWVPTELLTNEDIKSYIRKGDVRNAVGELVDILKNKPEVKNFYTVENKQWLYKTVYTIVSTIIKKSKP